MRLSVFVAALCLIVFTPGSSADGRPTRNTLTITIEGMLFVPDTLTVASGDTVVWINKDLVAHTATSQAGAFDSKMIAPDKSWRLTVRKKGEFAYVCTYHPTMKATLHVE